MQEMVPSYNIISLSWVGEAYVFRFLFIFFDKHGHTLHMTRVDGIDILCRFLILRAGIYRQFHFTILCTLLLSLPLRNN